jgi:hypothetical protein
MKTLTVTLVALVLACAASPSIAKEYKVANMSEGALKGACARGGGSFNSGENDYACTYKNGNIRDCSKKDGHCIMVTPKIVTVEVPDIFGHSKSGGELFAPDAS